MTGLEFQVMRVVDCGFWVLGAFGGVPEENLSVHGCLSVCSLNRFRWSCFEEHSYLFLVLFLFVVYSFFLYF